MPNNVCVVLNSQHQTRVDDLVERCKSSPDIRLVFQPYTPKRLRRLHQLPLPVPVYLVTGQFGAVAGAVAQLMKVEYQDEIPKAALPLLKDCLPITDREIYAVNLLFLAQGRSLPTPIPLARFKKVTDGSPLRRGRWTAVVCHLPPKQARVEPAESPDTSDDPDEALEGHLRLLFVRHRHRERGLRDAKIRAVLRETGRLRCEVKACGFEFETCYGELGRNYAQVHHLRPFTDDDGERRTSLDELAVVCANCHAMIHRRGACRSLDEVSATIRMDVRPNTRLDLSGARETSAEGR